MPAPIPSRNVDDAVRDYLSGESCQLSAARHRVGQGRLKAVLQERGVWRDAESQNALRAAKVSAAQLAASPIPVAEVAERYLAGESENAIAEAFGVSRNVIAARLRAAGVARRTLTQANRLSMEARTPEENRANTRAAHDAVRGTKQSAEHRAKIAATREERQTHVSEHELRLAELLGQRGLDVRPQAAVGPYNVDLATGTVAVEVFGGGWHAYGAHRKRTPQRLRHILDAGWNLVIVWASLERWPIGEGACDYIEAFAKLASSNPALRGEYRVIWGDGQDATRPGLDVDDLALKPARRGRLRAGPTDDRAG